MRIYETAIKIGAAISKTFKTDAYNAASALTKLTDATKKLKEAEKAAAAYKKLDEAVSKSKAKYDAASEALRRLEQAEKAAGGATKESTKWRKAGERAVASAAKGLDRSSKAAEKNGKALREMGVDTANLSKEQERLAKTLEATERRQKSLARYEGSRARLFGKRKDPMPLVEKAGGQIRGIARDVAVLGTAAFGAGAALAGLTLKTLKSGDEIGDTADKLGIGSTALQELRYGAEQSGAEVGAVDLALKKLAVSVGHYKSAKGKGGGGFAIPGLDSLDQAKAGGAGAVNPFKAIGLDAKKLAQLKPEEQFKKIADGFAKLKTHADKAATAQLIFGKGSAEILPFLEEGSAGIDKLSTAAHKYGGVLSVEAVQAADKADKAMRDAEYAFAGVANTLGGALLPVATKVFKEFSEWVSSNRGEIQKWAVNIAAWIENKGIPAIKTIASELQSFGSKVVWLVKGAADLVGGFENLGIAIVALRVAPLVLSFGQIAVAAAGMAPAVIAAAAPILAVAAAIGAVTFAIKEWQDVIQGYDDLKKFEKAHGIEGKTVEGIDEEIRKAKIVRDQRRKEKGIPAIGQPIGPRTAAGTGGGVNLGGVNVAIVGGSKDQVHGQLDSAFATAAEAAKNSYDLQTASRLSFAE